MYSFNEDMHIHVQACTGRIQIKELQFNLKYTWDVSQTNVKSAQPCMLSLCALFLIFSLSKHELQCC